MTQETKTVTENGEGNMAKAGGSSDPKAEVKTPEDVSKVSSEEHKVEDKKLYSQKELNEVVHIKSSEAGRVLKEVEDERDELKRTIIARESDVEDIQEERDKAIRELEDLTSGDPEKYKITEKQKEIREAEKRVKTATDDLAAKNKESDERVASANATLLEIAIWDVATEYKGGDPVKLKNLCESLGVTTEERLREVAGNLWEKTPEKPTGEKKAEGAEEDATIKKGLNLDSGASDGGKGVKTPQERLDERYPTMKQGN